MAKIEANLDKMDDDIQKYKRIQHEKGDTIESLDKINQHLNEVINQKQISIKRNEECIKENEERLNELSENIVSVKEKVALVQEIKTLKSQVKDLEEVASKASKEAVVKTESGVQTENMEEASKVSSLKEQIFVLEEQLKKISTESESCKMMLDNIKKTNESLIQDNATLHDDSQNLLEEIEYYKDLTEQLAAKEQKGLLKELEKLREMVRNSSVDNSKYGTK